MSDLQRIRQLVIDRRYYLSAHAEEEMWAVEAEVCRECGERYYHATTLDAIDQVLESGEPIVKEQLWVEVIGMPA